MCRFIKPLVVGLMLISSGFAAGTVYGFYNGLLAMSVLDSTPKALLASTNLKAMAAGNDKPVKALLESDVDLALFQYPLLKEFWWYPAYSTGFLIVNPDDYEKYIRKVATYRKAHPHLIQESASGDMLAETTKNRSEYEELVVGMRDYKKHINKTAELYANN